MQKKTAFPVDSDSILTHKPVMKNRGLNMRIAIAAVTLIVLLMAGCSKLTVGNYDRLKMGMPYEEVVKIIGAPDKCSDVMGVKNCEWGNEKKSINVTFAGDKVIFFTGNGLH
jgi:hypothetical protein